MTISPQPPDQFTTLNPFGQRFRTAWTWVVEKCRRFDSLERDIDELIARSSHTDTVGEGGDVTPAPAATEYFGLITDYNTASGEKWSYDIIAVRSTGLNDWEPDPDAPDTYNGKGYNLCESMNLDTGGEPWGNGVYKSQLPVGFTIGPAPIGLVVRIWWTYSTNGLWRRFFSFENPIIGECP